MYRTAKVSHFPHSLFPNSKTLVRWFSRSDSRLLLSEPSRLSLRLQHGTYYSERYAQRGFRARYVGEKVRVDQQDKTAAGKAKDVPEKLKSRSDEEHRCQASCPKHPKICNTTHFLDLQPDSKYTGVAGGRLFFTSKPLVTAPHNVGGLFVSVIGQEPRRAVGRSMRNELKRARRCADVWSGQRPDR